MTTVDLNRSHAQQRRDGVAESLTRAGIGRAYHGRKLADLGKRGEVLSAWLAAGAWEEVRRGSGWSIAGAGSLCYDTAMILARGLHLNRVPVRVLSLRRLVRALERDADAAEKEALADVPVLMVTDFTQTYGNKPECPLTGWQVQDVEDFLTTRLSDNRAVFTQSDRRLALANWWSQSLVQRLHERNREMEVA